MYIGIDHHRRTSHITALDEQGHIVHSRNYENAPLRVEEILQHLGPGPHIAVLEASPGWETMHNALVERGVTVKLAHPQRVKAIASAKIKTDRVDSKVLAQLLRADLIPESHIPSQKVLPIRKVLRQRKKFTEERTRTKNRIRDIIRRYPSHADAQIFKGSGTLFAAKGKTWMADLELKPEDRFLLNNELEHLEAMDSKVASSDDLIKDLATEMTEIRLIKTVPGIGDALAVLVWAEIDGIERFSSPDKLASYAGLTPTIHCSGRKDRRGPTGTTGNKSLRWAMHMAVPNAVKLDPELKRHFTRVKERRGGQVAVTATSRVLLERVHRVLTKRRPYDQLMPLSADRG